MGEGELAQQKAALRLAARAARRAVSPEMREMAAQAIAHRLLELPELQGVRAVLMYGASPEEADPLYAEAALRQRGVRVVYPRVGEDGLELHWIDDRDHLVRGTFGLLEPAPDAACALPEDIDAIIVPGVAFDESGRRLGYGGGYYDVLLKTDCSGVPAIGIGYDEQLFEHVPCDAGDQHMDLVITPTRTIRCATSRS
jgi:5-formyltetrahydrofolate cyclo-ligase